MEQTGGEGFDFRLYKQFYDIWVRSTSEVLDQMMRSPEFAAAMGRSLEASLDLKKRVEEWMESYLKALRLPTASDVADLSRRVRAVEEQVQGLSKELEELKARPSAFSDEPPSKRRPPSRWKS